MTRHGLTRRQTLELLAGATAAAATGCGRGDRRVVAPWVDAPADVAPGEPLRFATSLVEDGLGTGVLVESHDGRPTKIEGNPLHPASLGAAGPREQAALLGLYDPNRAGVLRQGTAPVSLRHFVEAFAPGGAAVGPRGDGVHLLLEPTSSPTTLRLLDLVRERLPGVTVHASLPDEEESARAGALAAFGAPVDVLHDPAQVDALAAFDADPLGGGPGWLPRARAWASRRRSSTDLLRTWVVEPLTTLTGAKADHRLARPPSRVPVLFAQLAARLLPGLPVAPALTSAPLDEAERAFVERVAVDLLTAGPRAWLAVGAAAPPWMHAVAHLVHARLGAPVRAIAPVRLQGDGLPPLLDALDAGAVRALVVLGGNPAYGAPAELRVASRLARAGVLARLGAHEDETSRLATWFVPQRHDLERWGDARAVDGTVGLIQPLIEPLFDGRTVDEVLAVLAGLGEVADRALVAATAGEVEPGLWRDRLRRGVVEGTAAPQVPVAVDPDAVLALARGAAPSTPTGLELRFTPCPKVADGRLANNPWLQELPHPVTRTSWTNVATLSPATAARLGVDTGDAVLVDREGAGVGLPVVVDPSQADDTVGLTLGYGREGDEVVAAGLGADVSVLRRAASPWVGDGGHVTRTGKASLPRVQLQLERHGRAVARTHDPHEPPGQRQPLPQVYGPSKAHLTAPHQWGMSIDLSTCIGCGACAVACTAENNVPVVGPLEVELGRFMHWIRIDRYVEPEGGRDVFQPMTCQHCETAPCEVVCPVYATSHSPDGINAMVFNRCVGTRFCSDACPYKVRRFNWFKYSARSPALAALQRNPDVTVRDRGVMEKCTFCVQRIRAAERSARLAERPLVDGDVTPACAQTCPTGAIVFGDVADPESRVSRLHADERSYAELEELGTRPRVRYLAVVRDEAGLPTAARRP